MSGDDFPNRHDAGDLACTRCRERKIRCNRERPQCSNCERDESATCAYQTPVKRVNHLKLLCNSFDKLHDRLTHIETDLALIAENRGRGEFASVAGEPSRTSSSAASDDGNGDGTTSKDTPPGDEPYVFHDQVEMTDSYHGFSSLFAMCHQLRRHTLVAHDSLRPGVPAYETLSNICHVAGVTEPFPVWGDVPSTPPLPKQQILTAVDHFFRHVDHTTDLFVPNSLRAHVERVYSAPLKPADESWAICFKAIFVLVLGIEISPRAGVRSNALFGDYALTLLPGRATLVNSRLLMSPRLVNVQTLMLLSASAQWLDPSGWAEVLHRHACMLARMMGLHRASDATVTAATDDEAVERIKVARALHIRDKFFCTNRGSMPWFPGFDSDIAVGASYPHADRLQLALIQDHVYCASHIGKHENHINSGGLRSAQQSIEQQLENFARTFEIFQCAAPYHSPLETQLRLDFLATRIAAFWKRTGKKHVEQVLLDARASCLLLLIAYGHEDAPTIDLYNSLCAIAPPETAPDRDIPSNQNTAIPFADALDSYSLPAFFVLLEGLLDTTRDDLTRSNDAKLLQRVAVCFCNATAGAPPNTYHRKLAWILSQLIDTVHGLIGGDNAESIAVSSAPPSFVPITTGAPIATMSDVSIMPTTQAPQNMRTSVVPAAPSPWDAWLTSPGSQAISSPPSTVTCATTDPMVLFPPSIDTMSNPQAFPWLDSGRKRRRTLDVNADDFDGTFADFDSTQELPFHLVS